MNTFKLFSCCSVVFLIVLPRLTFGGTYFRSLIECSGRLLSSEHEIIDEFESLCIVYARDSSECPRLPIRLYSKSRNAEGEERNVELSFMRVSSSHSRSFSIVPNEKTIMSAKRRDIPLLKEINVEGVTVRVEKLSPRRVEVLIAYKDLESRGVCVYKRNDEAWYRILSDLDDTHVVIPNVGRIGIGKCLRLFNEYVPVAIWLTKSDVMDTRDVIIVTEHGVKHGTIQGRSHVRYQFDEKYGVWMMRNVVFISESRSLAIDTHRLQSSIRLLEKMSLICGKMFAKSGSGRNTFSRFLTRPDSKKSGVNTSRGVWKSSDGLTVWFSFHDIQDGNTVFVVSTDESVREMREGRYSLDENVLYLTNMR